MVEFIVGFTFAVTLLTILSRQQSIKDAERYHKESADSLLRIEDVHIDKLEEFRKISHALNDIVNELESIRNKREG